MPSRPIVPSVMVIAFLPDCVSSGEAVYVQLVDRTEGAGARGGRAVRLEHDVTH